MVQVCGYECGDLRGSDQRVSVERPAVVARQALDDVNTTHCSTPSAAAARRRSPRITRLARSTMKLSAVAWRSRAGGLPLGCRPRAHCWGERGQQACDLSVLRCRRDLHGRQRADAVQRVRKPGTPQPARRRMKIHDGSGYPSARGRQDRCTRAD